MPITRSQRATSHAAQESTATRSGQRPGFAMFMALGALVIVAVLIAGSSFVSQQEARLGQNQLVQSRALAAAEYGLNRIQADWNRTPNLTMANGAFFDTAYTIPNQGTVTVRYVRLNNETFWIVSEGRATVGNSTSAARTAVKRVGAILRLRIPTIKANGAITTAGNVTAGGNANITGKNTTPPGWTGCAAAPDKAGAVIGPSASISIQKPSQFLGSPQYAVDSLAADSNTYVRFGDETWNALVASANITIASVAAGSGTPSLVSGACNRGDTKNWGEPWRTAEHADAVVDCYSYFPIIYITGSSDSQGGRGQGIMLVNGDFRFNAGFEWHGLIIAKDDITKANGHASIFGSVMARNATAGDPIQDFTGTVDISYSACALERAMRGSAQVVQARHRAWTEMY